jgi:hypothetical protein
VGINLAQMANWSRELAFVDLFKQAEGWLSQDVPHNRWNNNQALDLDEDGWVRSLRANQAAAAMMARGLGTHYPAGDYVCLYDGEGQLEFLFEAQAVSRTPGRIVVRVTPGSGEGIWLRLVQTNANNPLRNIRFIMPGFENTYQDEPFHPAFLARWEKFKVLRFMVWQRVEKDLERWAQRPTPRHPFQTGEFGVAAEHQIALANRLDADAWFCMPLKADDDYVRRFAELVRDQLEPGRKVYIEHSNEVWNAAFPQHRQAIAEGRRRNLHANDYDAAMFYHGLRSVEIGAIFEQVLDPGRVIRVLAMQAAVPWWIGNLLDYSDIGDNVDAVAIAPYIGNELGNPATQNSVARMSLTEVFDFMRRDMSEVMGKVRVALGHCQRHELDLITYEGGQHLCGYGGAENNQALVDLFTRANADPEMGVLYGEYLRAWRAAGGNLFVAFNSTEGPSKWGAWGLVRTHDSDLTREPKYKATVDFIAANPQWW